ncbi:MAG: DNA replication and repair protein RecF [Candidatus Anoxychlamydiales bacterium]|nr:DNA replication and repair protein RecF [Candidatus Anoxychlamydiales bacterium]
MQIKTLCLRNFRNFSSLNIKFTPGINLIFGENAIGKTSVLEALYLISCGRSFKTSNLAELINEKKSFFYIEAEILKDNILQRIKIYYDQKTKKIEFNKTKYLSFNNLLGIMPLILYLPQDCDLITSKPNIRRSFLNLHLAQKDPLYVHHLIRFTKALKQRNYLLKKRDEKNLFCFEDILINSASYITYQRKLFLEELNNPLQKNIKNLSKNISNLQIKYLSSIQEINSVDSIKSFYRNLLKKNRKKELDFKCTLFGPHRDEILFMTDDKISKQFSSEGQKKAIISALKLSEYELLKSKLQQSPLFAVDDFGVHLDTKHKDLLKSKIEKIPQVFITMPNIEKFNNANIIDLKSLN